MKKLASSTACTSIEAEIASLNREKRDLQQDLASATPGAKPALVRQIKAINEKISAAHRRLKACQEKKMALDFETTVGKASNWNWEVNAQGGVGKSHKSVSPENKVKGFYSFSAPYSGSYRLTIPFVLDGFYDVRANQVGAGGRRAQVRIDLVSRVEHRGQSRVGRKTILEKKVTKGREKAPFTYQDEYTTEIEAWVGAKESEWKDRDVSVSFRVELMAYARWRKSYAALNFIQPGAAGIKLRPGTLTLVDHKPRPGEQKF